MTERRIRLGDGAEMEVETAGTGGLRVAMLHGAMSSRRMFDALGDRLLAGHSGLSTLAVDLPGFGGASKPGGGYGYPAQAARIAEILREDPRPTVVVGHSMGGAIALTLLLAAPDVVDGLVLIGTGLGRSGGSGSIAAYGTPALDRELMSRYVAGWLVDPDPALVDALVEDAMRMTPASFDGVRAAIGAYDLGAAKPRLAALDLPVLVMRGARDRTRTAAEAAELATAFRHAALVEIPDAGHCPHLEKPEAAAAAILGWLGEVAAPAGTRGAPIAAAQGAGGADQL
ncbi:alpha/beta fold hydrolase [Acuticoccus sediminis]|uniref:alpha/beta fold hydrolase n=1 Tax=Acuticoccus sediminis TaxID=2184697 RepID=UPI001CFCEDCA|nr:alpha/beta hydrolase [Acuticoccus sediminis]